MSKMTVFDAIKDGAEYIPEICLATNKPHQFILFDESVKNGRKYETLVCEDCGETSEGWYDV